MLQCVHKLRFYLFMEIRKPAGPQPEVKQGHFSQANRSDDGVFCLDDRILFYGVRFPDKQTNDHHGNIVAFSSALEQAVGEHPLTLAVFIRSRPLSQPWWHAFALFFQEAARACDCSKAATKKSDLPSRIPRRRRRWGSRKPSSKARVNDVGLAPFTSPRRLAFMCSAR
jgi:hypothetical protein